MKVCSLCGATYKTTIDFCFEDGEVLSAAPDAMDAPIPGGVEVSAPHDEHPQIVPVEPPAPAPPAEEPSAEPERQKRGTLVPALGNEDDEEVHAVADDEDELRPPPSGVPTDVPSQGDVPTETPQPTATQGAGAAAPLADGPDASNDPLGGLTKARMRWVVALVSGVAIVVFVGFAVALVSLGYLGGGPTTVIEPKVVPPTPTPVAAPAPANDAEPAVPPEGDQGDADGGDEAEGEVPTEEVADEAPAGTDEAPTGEGADEAPAGTDEAPTGEGADEAPAGTDEGVDAPDAAPDATPEPEPELTPSPEDAAVPAPAPAPDAAPAPEPAAETPPEPEASSAVASGPVAVFFAGRVGDALSIDGKPAGILPARVTLTAGEHTFTVTGSAGEVTVTKTVVLQEDGSATLLHLQ